MREQRFKESHESKSATEDALLFIGYDVTPEPNTCPGAPQNQETYSFQPIWINVLSQGVVDSMSSTP